jgi:predicted aspartyl protease
MMADAVATAVVAVLGAAPALAASSSPYDAFDQTAYLAYLNAPAANDDLTRPPRLRISFGGGRSYDVVMDTGSTGIVVSADKIPNIDRLQSLGPGQLTYSSSGRIMIGRWVVTPLTVMGRNGTSIAIAPIPVLAVDRVECTGSARRCSPRENPRGISMLGVGFARRHDHEAQSGPSKNPFLNVASVNGAKAERLRRGYLVTRGGVFVGLTAANTKGDFAFVKLDRAGDDWAPTPVCISVNGATPAACGTLLMDTGVSAMYLTVPESQAPAAITTTNGRSPTLVDGTKVAISIPTEASPRALYSARTGAAPSRQPRAAAIRQYQRAFPQRVRLSLRCRRRFRGLALDRPCRADVRQGDAGARDCAVRSCPGSRFARPGHERANSRRAKRTVGHGLKLTMSNSAVFFLPAARLCAPGLSVLFAPALPEASV